MMTPFELGLASCMEKQASAVGWIAKQVGKGALSVAKAPFQLASAAGRGAGRLGVKAVKSTPGAV